MRLTDLRPLIVDDDRIVRQFLYQLLVGQGMLQTATADCGEKALSLIEARRPDIIVSDWMMSDMDGLALLGHVRAIPQYRRIPFIMVTCQAAMANVKQAIEAGASDYVVKPFRSDIILGKIMRLLRETYPDLAR